MREFLVNTPHITPTIMADDTIIETPLGDSVVCA
jgi:hypothetical protein